MTDKQLSTAAGPGVRWNNTSKKFEVDVAAHEIIYGDAAGVPQRLAMGASSILARKATGSIVAATPAEVRAILGDASNRWAAPSSPDARDDEFESTTLDPAWVTRDGTMAAWTTRDPSVNPYSSPASGHIGVAAHTDYRPSWLALQPSPSSGSGQVNLTKLVSLGTNDHVYARFGSMTRHAGIATADGENQLTLFANSAGVPDVQNRISIGWHAVTGSNTLGVRFLKLVANAFTDIIVGADVKPSTSSGRHWTTFGLHKIGTTYHAWAFDDAQNSYHIGSTTFTPTVGHVCITGTANTTTTPGSIIFGTDFIRFNASATFIP